MEYLLVFILIFMIMAAMIALWTDELLSAVIAVGAVGFGASTAFLLLGAPDLAITQIVVEVVTLVLLIKATIGVGVRTTSVSLSARRAAPAAAVVVLLLSYIIVSFRAMPPFGSSVMERIADAPSITYLEEGLDLAGSANHVMSVLLDFRAYDTLGEATIIFTAVLGALLLMRKKGQKSRDIEQKEEKE